MSDSDDIPVVAPAADGDGPAGVPGAVCSAWERLGRPPAARLTVAVNDPQRHTDTPRVLAALRELAGDGLRLVVACGSHRFDPGARRRFERRLTDGAGAASIAWHDATEDSLVDVGGWRAHPWLAAAEAVLAVGSVEPHYFAGFTGAHKTLTVGTAAYADIERNHVHALSPECRPARLMGNPVHDGIARMLHSLATGRRLAAVNLVQSGSRILAAFGGEPLAALQAAVPIARRTFARTTDTPADAVVAEVAGPLGRSFYQADKGIKNTEAGVRDGGVVVLVAGCEDGLGQDRFCELLREASTHAEARRLVAERGYRLGDHKAVRLRALTDPAGRGVRLLIVAPGLSEADASLLGAGKAATVAKALSSAGVDPEQDRVVHVEDAGNACLTLGSD